ncbi:MAG: hypothetical protein HQK91_05135 [Nitrospirae bacterium]|nr:hypothetical protein [Nitrospirota bacterium]MBF0540817.1 hypothetical protein [Nitrospirota bacterium]
MFKIIKKIFFIALFLHLLALCPQWSQQLYAAPVSTNPIQALINRTLVYFTPIDIVIKDIKSKTVFIEPSAGSLLIKGMRLDVIEQGDVFYHPVTKEEIGHLENNTGVIEIADVDKKNVHAQIINGVVNKSDKARITNSKIKALYFQQSSLDWYVGDACYRELLNSKRFEMFDSKNKDGDLKKLIAEAKEKGAQIILYADDVSQLMKPILRLRIYWTSDGKEITAENAELDYKYIKSINPKSTLLFASRSEPIMTFELNSDARLITVGSFTDRNKKEILIVADSSLSIYQGDTNSTILAQYQLPSGAEPLYVGAVDLNQSGRDEVILTTINKDIIHSYIYEIENNKFNLKWETDGMLEVMQNKLLYQGCNPKGSSANPIYYVKWDGVYKIGDVYLKQAALPGTKDNINLYNFIGFNITNDEILTLIYDPSNHLILTDMNKKKLWQGEEMSSSSVITYTSNCDTKTTTQWYKNNKLMILNKNILVVNNKSATNIVMLWWDGNTIDNNVIINDINGKLIDYAVSDGWIYVLTKSTFSKETKNFFKGKYPFMTYVQVFSLNY